MSPIEDEIRVALHAEAARLQEMRPLRLPAAVDGERESGAGPGAPRARRLRAWLGPAAAAAVVLLVAVGQVTLKSAWDARGGAPAVSPSTIAGPALTADAVPRYYVYVGWDQQSSGPDIVAGDEQTRKTLGFVSLVPAGSKSNGSVGDVTVTSAADDQTFVVSASVGTTGSAAPPLTWYLVEIRPGSADPVQVSALPVTIAGSGSLEVITAGLSADGTELAVVTAKTRASSGPLTLQVYSVITGRLQHSWPAGAGITPDNRNVISDLSWVGDSTVGFAVTYTPEVREEVRTLDVSASGGTLLADSRVVWSQDVPATPLTPREKAVTGAVELSPHACDTPFLTGNGQAVVCGDSTFSAATKRLAVAWLAYPLATPARPRVLGRVQEPRDVSALNGSIKVEWANPSGTEVVGAWNPEVITGPAGNPRASVNNNEAYVGNGTVTLFPHAVGGLSAGW